MMNQGAASPDAGPEIRLRTMRILWAAFLVTIGLFALVTYFARPAADTLSGARQESPALLLAFALIGLTSVAASFVLKSGFYTRAAEQRQPAVLQTGFILALALCEAAVLVGLVGLFVTWNDYAYGLFALGFVGELLHFPRREQVMPAYFKPGM